jgi:hypothetical protein
MFNERPVDPEWVALADKLADEAGEKLGAYVVMIAAQEGGKLGMALASPAGELGRELKAMHDCFHKNVADGLRRLADAIDMNERGQPLKLEFAPGAFDGFEGTQEELQELLATIHKEFESGNPLLPFLHERMDPDESEEVSRRMAEQLARRTKPQ